MSFTCEWFSSNRFTYRQATDRCQKAQNKQRRSWQTYFYIARWRWFFKLLDAQLNLKVSISSQYFGLDSFKVFGTGKDTKQFLNVFERLGMRYRMIYVDEETFGTVIGLKQTRLNRNRRQYETKWGCGKDCYVHRYFIFPAQRCSIGRKLQNRFNERILEFKSYTQRLYQYEKLTSDMQPSRSHIPVSIGPWQ